MLALELNPPDVREVYLKSLNTCFPDWGGHARFAWAFERRVGGPKADLMVLRDNGVLLAGSAVTYRTLVTGSHRMLVGIMTGSWTLPEARGHGCFSRIIVESVALAAAHGAGALLAFVTESNASYRRLRDAGSILFPTTYFVTPEDDGGKSAPARDATDGCCAAAELMEMCAAMAGTRSHILYTPEEWQSQFLSEGGARVIALEDLGWAVVGTKGDFNRIEALALADRASIETAVRLVASDARARGKRLFAFSMDTELASACERSGLRPAPGFLTALVTDRSVWESSKGVAPFFQSGDRM